MSTTDVRSVDEFVASFYEGARLDSQGVFTIDLEQRSRKLQKYQLSQPEFFVLSLVRSATLGGAQHIALEHKGVHISLSFDGRPFTHDELRVVCEMLNQESVVGGSPRLQTLGYALLLAANLTHGGLSFQSAGYTLLRQRRSWRIHETESSHGSRLQLERSPWEWLLPGRLSKTHQVLDRMLKARCIYGPARLNLHNPFSLDPTESALVINDGPPIPSPQPGLCLGQVKFIEQPDCHGWVSLGGSRTQVILVSAGVAEVLAEKPSSHYGYQAVLWCDSLQTDLGGVALVRDDTFMRLLRMLVIWLIQLELESVLQFYASHGMARLLQDEASRATLWGYRQQVLLCLEPVRVHWLKRPSHCLPVDLGAVAQVYARHRWLAVAAESEGDICLDDGTPIVFPTPETEPLLQLVYPNQREFFNCFGRAVPRQLSLRTLFQDGLFRRHSGLMYDALIGENWAGPDQTWIYEDGHLSDVREADPRLPSGTTLVQFSPDCLSDEQVERLLLSLKQAGASL